MNQFRRAYFARLGAERSAPGAAPADFGVDVDRIAAHVLGAVRRRPRAKIDIQKLHLRDVGLAAACAENRPGAWAQLISEYEPRLIRAIEPQQGPTQAVVTVRRMIIEMRHAIDHDARSPLDLRRYSGEKSLESWLFDRLSGRVAVTAAIRRADSGKQRADAAHRLHLALQLLGNERLSVKRLAEALASSSNDRPRVTRAEALARPTRVEDKHG